MGDAFTRSTPGALDHCAAWLGFRCCRHLRPGSRRATRGKSLRGCVAEVRPRRSLPIGWLRQPRCSFARRRDGPQLTYTASVARRATLPSSWLWEVLMVRSLRVGPDGLTVVGLLMRSSLWNEILEFRAITRPPTGPIDAVGLTTVPVARDGTPVVVPLLPVNYPTPEALRRVDLLNKVVGLGFRCGNTARPRWPRRRG